MNRGIYSIEITFKVVAISLFVVLLNRTCFSQGTKCIKTIDKDRLYARVRSWTSPSGGTSASFNPPALKWPVVKGEGVKYKIRIAQDTLFRPTNTINSGFFPWAVYTPDEPLNPGKWYWQFASITSKGQQLSWSSVNEFVIQNNTPELIEPNFDELFSRCNRVHPRLWLTDEDTLSFRRRNKYNTEANQVIQLCQELLDTSLPEIKPIHNRDTTGMSDLDKRLTVTYNYHGLGKKIAKPIKTLCLGYMLTEDPKYASAGIKRALQIARLDPDGAATKDDFNSGACMEAMAIALDRFYGYLSTEDKNVLLKAIQLRGNDFYYSWINNFESKLADNHIWQHLFREFVVTSIATVGELKDAERWLNYAYEIWRSRFPILGTKDGGWYEGNGYFPVQFETLIYLPLIFGQFTGIDYFRKFKWFKNLPYYMIYSFPSNSTSTGIGDKHEAFRSPTRTWVAFANALSKKIENPYFQNYVIELNKTNPEALKKDRKFRLFRMLNFNVTPAVDSLVNMKNLPRARLFKDIGLAISHTNLNNPRSDLMVSLSACPFGVVGHAHASQNALTINWRGRPIFGGSGYYSNFSDKHNLLHYRTTRAYCTMLADSIGQSLGTYGYGWISRFITGKYCSYFVGDASNAYGGKLSPFWKSRINRRNIDMTKKNGFGNAGVDKFRRHVLTLKDNIILVYDVLEADHPVQWTWQLHSTDSIRLLYKQDKSCTFISNIAECGLAKVSVFSPVSVSGIVHNRFNSPAINWKGKERNGEILTYQRQWHAGVTSSEQKSMRFLSIFVVGNQEKMYKYSVNRIDDSSWKIGHFIVEAGMKNTELPFLRVTNESNTIAFGFNVSELNMKGKSYKAKEGASVLLEWINGKIKYSEVCDSLPVIVKNSN